MGAYRENLVVGSRFQSLSALRAAQHPAVPLPAYLQVVKVLRSNQTCPRGAPPTNAVRGGSSIPSRLLYFMMERKHTSEHITSLISRPVRSTGLLMGRCYGRKYAIEFFPSAARRK